jgi:N-methylhydantoinase A
MRRGIEIGIDIGGTFVDIVIADSNGLRVVKSASTPRKPAEGVLEALGELIRRGDLTPTDVSRIIHGSTVATNALLEAKWGRVALITTRGFRDVLEIGRQNRPRLYDLEVVRPTPIVPRDLRFEVTERVTSDGSVEIPLSLDEVRELIPHLRAAKPDAVAVAYLFSYLRPEHERLTRELLVPEMDLPIVLSSDVLPEFREFERTSTTVISACLRPVVGEYLAQLERGAARLGLPERWQVMQSSGSIMVADAAERQPDRLLLSGPAAGVQGARAIGLATNEPDLITMDMGGTSCDVSMILDGSMDWTASGSIGGYPAATPMVAIHTIGAGGGSIAWIDAGGALRVGPRSAGAEPGPACYGRGGTLPTVTDAHFVLGHLGPSRSFGGLPPLDPEASRHAIETEVAEPLGMPCEAAALGILEVADAAMERAIRVVSVERGRDPREYALLAFGGAGPLHAVSIARRLGIPRVVVPSMAGALSAYGLLVAEPGHDLSQGLVQPLEELNVSALEAVFARLASSGTEMLRSEGVNLADVEVRRSVDLRYVGQSHELNVPTIGEPGRLLLEETRGAFDRLHRQRYGHSAPDEAVEIVTARVRVSAAATPRRRNGANGGSASGAVPESDGRVWFDSSGPVVTRIVDRSALPSGGRFVGPMVIAAGDSTLLVPPGVVGRVDEGGEILLWTTNEGDA